MLWCCLIIRRVGSLYKIEQTFNVVHYLELLQKELYITGQVSDQGITCFGYTN
jgi:hypothetical protein